ncbi:MAG: 1-deoxy-D-xylulose-5-phosphate synthase, partial [Coriobacteriia bacterium]|nr:1-deoxy-D-xylulose-5-phosphate synthase [Coriobacteriia bacterium]
MSVLERIGCPSDVKNLSRAELSQLACDLRAEMIAATSLNGGHLAPSLGAVEIILAAYRVLDLPKDKLLFDVGHQAYAHKLLTGRLSGFAKLRRKGGVSGFTRREESPYDVHDAGHASDSLATALGLALGRDLDGSDERIMAVIGDASIAGGLAMEALNYIGQTQARRFVIVLNDNEMSISHSVGALSSYLASIRTNERYRTVRDSVEEAMTSAGPIAAGLMRLGNLAKASTQRAKLDKTLGSIADLTRLPSALFVIDVMKENIA